MILPDVNVLIYAYREDSRHHDLCRSWLVQVMTEGQPLALSSHVLAGVVRITTNKRIFDPPSPADDVLGFCNDLLGYPGSRMIEPDIKHWEFFSSLLQETAIRGPMVTDAWLAALALEWNCELVTLDRDFARFSPLKWSMPQ